jgi:hypothetical protein
MLVVSPPYISSELIANGTIVDADISTSAAIANSKLANSSITINGTAVSLGGSINITSGTNLRRTEEFTATSGQTSFTITGGYVAGNIDVYINGVQLATSDFTATNGTSITLTESAVVNDLVRTICYDSNYVPPSITASSPLSYNASTGALTINTSTFVTTGKSIAMAIVFG